MIGYLKGVVAGKQNDDVILDVSGVGYKVTVTDEYKVSQKVELFVHTYVREDTISLYGFSDIKSLDLFELLISVSGIGPKVAVLVVKSSSADKVINAISKADVTFFTSISGIGKKGAQKIIIELKSKTGSLVDIDLSEDIDNDIVDGLVAMGFGKKQAQKAIVGVDSDLSDKEKIKMALGRLTKK